MDINLVFLRCIGFQWDEYNIEKNWDKHNVSSFECEEIFFNEPLIVADDAKHSEQEIRFYALGKTNRERQLMIVFTVRNNLIRVISARDMSKKERMEYKKHAKENTFI